MLWTPILLLHLGGQDGITAYSIVEDNELWRRHVLTAVSQVTVAIYVFRKSWSGDKRLLQAPILVFVPGILKCMDKPWALKNASINSIVNEDSIVKRKTSSSNKDRDINSLGKYVEAAANYFKLNEGPRPDEEKKPEKLDKPYNLCVDFASPYSERLRILKYFVRHQDKAHELLRSGLSRTFERFYTKEQVRPDMSDCNLNLKRYCGQLMWFVVVYLILAAIGLFHKSHLEAYNDIDVKVTYILLCCSAVLEFITKYLRRCMCCLRLFRRPWPDQIAQYDLIWYLARNKKHRRLRKLTKFLPCKDYLDQLWCMAPCKSESSRNITELARHYIVDWWKGYIEDVDTYRAFNNNRGQQTLHREECKHLEWSLQRPFDENVLHWHLATDFCFYAGNCPSHEDARYSREISNYMAYLLFVNPEMLVTGARRSLFKHAYNKLKKMVNENTALGEKDLTKKIIQKMEGTTGSGFVRDAWTLAQELMAMQRGGE